MLYRPLRFRETNTLLPSSPKGKAFDPPNAKHIMNRYLRIMSLTSSSADSDNLQPLY